MKDFWREFGRTDVCFPQMKNMHLFPRNLNKNSKAVIQASCGGTFFYFFFLFFPLQMVLIFIKIRGKVTVEVSK